jgi:hypothetical protein
MIFVHPAQAIKWEVLEGPPPSVESEIETLIQKVSPEELERRLLLYLDLRKRLQKLPPFFADTRIESPFLQGGSVLFWILPVGSPEIG